MFYLRLNKVHVINKRERFPRGSAELKFISLVSTSEQNFADIEAVLKAKTDEERIAALQTAGQGLLDFRFLPSRHKVHDNSDVTFSTSGTIVYQSETIPDSLIWQLIVIETDSDLGDQLQALLPKIFDSSTLSSLNDKLKVAADRVESSIESKISWGEVIVVILKQVGPRILRALGKNNDDLVGNFTAVLHRNTHFPYAERKVDDKWDDTSNMSVDYTIFGFE